MIPPDCQPKPRLLLNKIKYNSVVATPLANLWLNRKAFAELKVSFIRHAAAQPTDYFYIFGSPLETYENRYAANAYIWSFSKIELYWRSRQAHQSTIWATVRNDGNLRQVQWEFDNRSDLVVVTDIFKEVLEILMKVEL